MESTSISTLAELDTLYNADSLEWCSQNPAYLVCGTYQLIEGTSGGENEQKSSQNNTRVGSIILLNYNPSRSLSEVQKISTAAVTDMKWCSQTILNGKPVLGVASSAGDIALYNLIETESSCNLEKLTSLDICSPKLSLSLDWSCNPNTDSEQKVVVSDSGGDISEMTLSGRGALELKQKWKAHNLSAWITAYDRWNMCTVYSGGDDCTLKGWDTRTGCYKPIFVNKAHTMGVCSVQSNPHRENIFASGSYDELVCVWDSRYMEAPLVTCAVGGGIWRIKWHPEKPNYMLTACCDSGFHVLKVDSNKKPETLMVIGSYTAHESLAYGADWGRDVFGGECDVPDNSLHEVLATCSFYDHSLHLWEMTYKEA